MMGSEQYESQYDLEEESVKKNNALNLEWVLGLNYMITDGVHNLTNETRSEIFYASAHTAVIYDYKNKTQRLLQGHCNNITCTAYCPAEDILISADSGEDSMLVVWDARTGTPKKTIFDPHKNGCEALDISPDGRYIVTMSRETSKDQMQEIALWDWQNQEQTNLVAIEIHPSMQDYLNYIRFNPDDQTEFVTTGKISLAFFRWNPGEKGFSFYAHFAKANKQYTQTAFIPKSKQAVTGTNDGCIQVWDISLIMEDSSQPEERRAIKQVNLMNTSNKSETAQKRVPPSINILKVQGDYLVVGASNGSIRFYDFQYRIIAWFEEFKIGRITSISFSQHNPHQSESLGYDYPEENEEDEEKFQCPDFIIVDTDAKITLLKAKYFEEIDEKDKLKEDDLILQSIVASIESISIRPTTNTVAIGCSNGRLYLWDYYTKIKKIKEEKNFLEEVNPAIPLCVTYSPDGRYLIVGTNIGYLHIFDHQKNQWQKVVQVSESHKPKILFQTFASNSQYFATMDDDWCVSLFKIDHLYGDVTRPKEWVFYGKIRSHTLPIRSIAFGESLNENGETYLRLFSVGEDKKLVEYDVHASNQDILKLVSIFQVEQECNPTACIWNSVNMYKEDMILVANEEYKLKLWNVRDPENRIGHKTCLGPIYGGAINQFLLINPPNARSEYDDKFLAYSTPEKIIGIIKLPIDGKPNHTMGLIAHPGKVSSISVSGDGKHLFTSGGSDQTVNIWRIDTSALQDDIEKGMAGLINMLEGGEEGETLRNLKDFFYYSQIRSKDENTTKARKLDGKVPLSEIPNLMRAMGYYPTQKEIENMQNEVKYSKLTETGELVEEFDLEVFIRLFINHGPVNGIGRSEIEVAVNELSKQYNTLNPDNREKYLQMLKNEKEEGLKELFKPQGYLTREELLTYLLHEGERMEFEELRECLVNLVGDGEIEDLLPEQIHPDTLIKNILEFEDAEEEEMYQEGQEEEGEYMDNNQ